MKQTRKEEVGSDAIGRFDDLSPAKRRLLQQRIKERGRDPLSNQTIPRRARSESAPLSFAQQRLWFLAQYEPAATVYNMPGAFRLSGRLDTAALKLSLNEIVRRHESLRTTFSVVDGEPVQVIAPPAEFSLPVLDLSDNFARAGEEAQRVANEVAQQGFDLEKGPLFRSQLLKLGEDDHVLLLTMHHIVSDGWSMGVLHRELSALYRAFVHGEPSPLEELPLQYADFAVWQREWLQGEVLEEQLTYWKVQLEGIPALLNLPTDQPRAAVQSFRGAPESFSLSEELTVKLKSLSRQEGVTLFMTLLAAFQTLLYRYTGQEDIVVGSPIANRHRTEIEGLIGFFVNTLVLRARVSGDQTFKEVLAGVKETTLGAYAHQDLPFEKLVEELNPERHLGHSPLFRVMFNMVNHGNVKFDLDGIAAEPFSHSVPESKFDITLYAGERDHALRFHLVYNTDLFSAAWMMSFSQQYLYLLEQIVVAPRNPIGSYSLVSPAGRALLPDPTVVLTAPCQELVTRTFWSWSERSPSHPAVSQGPEIWTYAELAQAAGVLARLLVAGGLTPREVVAVYGQPSFGLIAAAIATFLSGGVLLLLDPTLPIARKQRMLREGGAKKLLYVGVGQAADAWLAEDWNSKILLVDPQSGCADDSACQMDLASIVLPQLSSEEPAYLFFTSGTTGVPKGVLGCHKGLSHFLNWQRATFAIGPGDRVAQLTALSFDAVLRDIFLPLTSGATLCLPDATEVFGSNATIAWLEREEITVLHAVPSLAQAWLAGEGAKCHLGSMRWIFFVGEPLTEALLRQWRKAFQNTAEIVNLYGPTETTLVKCFYRIPVDPKPGIQSVGRPIPNTQALVLNDHKQLCGVNEPGEIVLRTPFRSLGYVNAVEENHKRFVQNPFRDDRDDQVYFTGDVGCYAPDGSLHILGRCDDQIKIRGVRIEPAEVTALLAGHPLVHSCIVVGKKDEQSQWILTGYVVGAGAEKPTQELLRSYLLEQLPAAMVPSAFVWMNALPLTPNGKIDRKSLPAPDHTRTESESYIPPRTRTERVVAEIWGQVLKLEKVGIYDNFFDLGGHSLLATQIVSRLRQTFRLGVPLRVLFEKPTVAGLSDHIKTVQQTATGRKALDADDPMEEIAL